MMCECDGDPPEFYNRKTVKGRKPHRCCECLQTISVGESHEVASGKWDGDFQMFRTCAECIETRSKMDCECIGHGGLIDYISEGYFDDIPQVVEFKKRLYGNFDRIQAEKQQQAKA